MGEGWGGWGGGGVGNTPPRMYIYIYMIYEIFVYIYIYVYMTLRVGLGLASSLRLYKLFLILQRSEKCVGFQLFISKFSFIQKFEKVEK